MGLGWGGMGRPPLELGTAGAIRYYKTATGYRARVLVRDYDGRVRALERRVATKAAADRALKTALRDRAPGQARGELVADSRVTVLAEAWYAGLAALSPVTLQAYRDRLDRQILPRLGQLRIRELSVDTLDRHLRGIADTHGVATARMCRSVLSGMCTLAARHDAMAQNPVPLGPVTGRAKTRSRTAWTRCAGGRRIQRQRRAPAPSCHEDGRRRRVRVRPVPAAGRPPRPRRRTSPRSRPAGPAVPGSTGERSYHP